MKSAISEKARIFESNLQVALIIEGRLFFLYRNSFDSVIPAKAGVQEVINKKGCSFVELRFYNCILWFPRGIYYPEWYSTFVEKPLQIHPKNAKQTQFFPVFNPKMKISIKNKPNSNPIQTQTNPKFKIPCSIYVRKF